MAAENQGYDDFSVGNQERFYTHLQLPYCRTHTISAISVSPTSGVEVTVTFYIGDILRTIETLTDERIVYIEPGVTRIGYKTTTTGETTIVRSWSER